MRPISLRFPFADSSFARCLFTQWRITLAFALAIFGGGVTGPLRAQETKEVPKKEELTLETKDDVVLKATFWPGTAGKETVPVILLHGYNGSRQDLRTLGDYLQREKGYAVIAPDLRGHGESTTVRDVRKPLQAASMPMAMFPAMTEDLEAVKKVLMTKNNAGELNIDKLCVVGADMGAVLAANWAALDWSWEPLAVGKQGQDVKALVLISPPERFKSLRMSDPLSDAAVRRKLSMYVIVGNGEPSAVRDATKIYTTLKRFHPEPSKKEETDLFFEPVETRLQGTKLLSKEFGLLDHIAQFIEARAANQPLVWNNRTLP